MKNITRIILIVTSSILICSCDKDESAPNAVIYKILPLGASRVQGNRPEFESFRYELWKDLIENEWKFDFIGTQIDLASYPSFNGNNFDVDHEGRSGWTSGQILSELNNWLNQTGSPDIVLFSSPAGNDALSKLNYNQAIVNINSIIDVLQTINPNVIIIIEQLAPISSNIITAELSNYFSQLQQDVLTIASEQSTSSSKVIAVDMYTDFTEAMLADGIHYNEAGADFIAKRYYNVLVNILEE